MDKAKNEIILATLEKHGGSTTFQVIMDVAEEYHCDVCSAALNSLKRKKAVEYEGMMLLLPNDADVIVSCRVAPLRRRCCTSPEAETEAEAAPAPARPAPAPRRRRQPSPGSRPAEAGNVSVGMTVRRVAAPEETGTVSSVMVPVCASIFLRAADLSRSGLPVEISWLAKIQRAVLLPSKP